MESSRSCGLVGSVEKSSLGCVTEFESAASRGWGRGPFLFLAGMHHCQSISPSPVYPSRAQLHQFDRSCFNLFLPVPSITEPRKRPSLHPHHRIHTQGRYDVSWFPRASEPNADEEREQKLIETTPEAAREVTPFIWYHQPRNRCRVPENRGPGAGRLQLNRSSLANEHPPNSCAPRLRNREKHSLDQALGK
jgi:hypothetical protein